jgi:hypothetical protein
MMDCNQPHLEAGSEALDIVSRTTGGLWTTIYETVSRQLEEEYEEYIGSGRDNTRAM